MVNTPHLSNKQKREIIVKAKPNALQDELEEMIFVKQFFWNTLPIKL